MTVIRRAVSCYKNITKGHILRWFCIMVATVTVIEICILHIIGIYLYRVISRELSEISPKDRETSLFDRLQQNHKINNFLIKAKAEGLFLSLLQESIERMYIINDNLNSLPEEKVVRDLMGREMKRLSFIGIDVSHSREATYIYNRILTKKNFPYHFLVVDIGANDGFLSSNSFNFIQWGWDAVLVEPQPMEFHIAEHNVRQYVDKYNDGIQSVKFVQSVIGSSDGSIEFVITKHSQGAESHVRQEDEVIKDGNIVVEMPCMTVKTLTSANRIPKNFGILSIDAEGAETEILRQWIALGFRPAYIILEHLHLKEPLDVILKFLEVHNYHYLGSRGWNRIFEHSEEKTS